MIAIGPTAQLPKDALNLARRYLESENLSVDVVVRDRPLYNEHGHLDQNERSRLLHELHDINLAKFMEKPGSVEAQNTGSCGGSQTARNLGRIAI